MKRLSRRSMLQACVVGCAAPVTAVVAGKWLAGCGDGTPAQEFDTNAMLRDLSTGVMAATLAEFAKRADALSTALGALAADVTTSTLGAARDAWVAARAPWKQSQSFAFGPAKDLEANIDWWPADPVAIDEIVAAGPPFDVPKLGTNKKGMMALEALLFDPEASDADVVTKLSEGGAAFADALGKDLASVVHELSDAWDPSGGNYAGALGEAGVSSDIYKSPKDAVDAIVNEMVFLADATAALISKPLGLKTGGEIAPELEESARSDNSLTDIEDRIRSIDNVWEGRFADHDGLGIADMVKSRSEPLVGEIRTAIDKCYDMLDAVPGTFRAALVDDPASLEAAYNAIIELKRVIGSDVVTVLGVTLTFNDNDGD